MWTMVAPCGPCRKQFQRGVATPLAGSLQGEVGSPDAPSPSSMPGLLLRLLYAA
jgi:hypothetical protein